GEWIEKDESLDVLNPATGEKISSVSKANTQNVQSAIESAHLSITEWSKLTAKTRSDYLRKAADLLRDRVDPIAKIITKEMGKPLNEAKGEINLAAEYL